MLRHFKWRYKDSHRMYWLIVATEIEGNVNKADDHPLYGGKYFETQWKVSIYRDFSDANECSDCVYNNIVNTQYDEPIILTEVLSDWSNYCQNVMFGFIRFSDSYSNKGNN